MQNPELIIDDGYISEMAEYFDKQGRLLQNMVDSYIAAMKRVSEEGIVNGDTSEVLKAFAEYAENLRQVILSTAVEIRDSAMDYLEEVDTQDHYLY